MESAKPPTTSSMLLLKMFLLWFIICGLSNGTPLANHELQMLEMMRNILGVDSSDLGGRSQRSSPMMFASSVPCEDSLSEDSSDSYNFFDEDLEDSEECGDYGRPCATPKEVPTELEPCPRPLLPMDHPCFVRVYVLRTPLLRHDPCTNFTLASVQTPTTTTTSTTPKPKIKKCRTKKKPKPKPEPRVASVIDNTTTPATTMSTVTTSTIRPEAETSAETTAMPTTTTFEPENNTTLIDTTTEELTTTMEDTTTTEPPKTTTTTTTTPAPKTTNTITSSIYTRKNQLKSLRGRRRKNKRPNVPDTPKIKLDGTMQSSDALPVFHSTEAAEIKSRPENTTTTTTTIKPIDIETTTEDCIEDISDVESDIRIKDGNQTEELSSVSEDCEDAEDQDTNLCPQFSAPEEPANMRLSEPPRYRKPVKNYVEPILYEGQFAKPRQRIGMLPPQRRDYYVSNKQIMPRPRPKYREPVPHSIYMNNIVRGLKCSDEVDGHPHSRSHTNPLFQPHSLPTRRYRNGKPTPPQRVWMGRRPSYGPSHGPSYAPVSVAGQVPGSQPPSHGHVRVRSNPLYGLGSGEDSDSYDQDSEQYYDDGSAERLPWSREQHSQISSSAESDPCAAEHRQERERERARERERKMERERQREQETEHNGERDNDHHQDYPQPVAPRFFT